MEEDDSDGTASWRHVRRDNHCRIEETDSLLSSSISSLKDSCRFRIFRMGSITSIQRTVRSLRAAGSDVSGWGTASWSRSRGWTNSFAAPTSCLSWKRKESRARPVKNRCQRIRGQAPRTPNSEVRIRGSRCLTPNSLTRFFTQDFSPETLRARISCSMPA